MCYAFVVLALASACGGRVIPPREDGGGSTSGSGAFPICPANPPEIGAPCSSIGQGCRYETGGRGTCAAYACTDGTWRDAPEGC
jgi:hypothetical protein